jgi:5'-nucleotidase
VQRDARVATAIAPHIERARLARAQPLGVQVIAPVARASAVESPLSNLVADLILRGWPKADVAINNGGSVRVPLAAGPLTYGQVFEVFPFDNVFATVTLDARGLAMVIERSLRDDHSIVALAGLEARAHCHGTALEVDIFRPDGTPVPPDQKLLLVTNDYVASRGDALLREDSVAPGGVTVYRERLIRDALVEGLRAYPGGRIDGTDPKLFDAGHPRMQYPGARPVHCP